MLEKLLKNNNHFMLRRMVNDIYTVLVLFYVLYPSTQSRQSPAERLKQLTFLSLCGGKSIYLYIGYNMVILYKPIHCRFI